MFRTVQGLHAAPQSDQGAAPSTALDRAYVVSIAPAASPVARGARPVAAGSYPVWLVQTDGSGIERARCLIQSQAPIHLAEGTGARWYLVAGASVAAGSDVAWDVTYGDHPGDWMEYAAGAGGGAASPLYEEELVGSVVGPLTLDYLAKPIDVIVSAPEWARCMALDALHTGGPTAGAYGLPWGFHPRLSDGSMLGGVESQVTDSGLQGVYTGTPGATPGWQHLYAWGVPAVPAIGSVSSPQISMYGPMTRWFRFYVQQQGGADIIYGAGVRTDFLIRWGA